MSESNSSRRRGLRCCPRVHPAAARSVRSSISETAWSTTTSKQDSFVDLDDYIPPKSRFVIFFNLLGVSICIMLIVAIIRSAIVLEYFRENIVSFQTDIPYAISILNDIELLLDLSYGEMNARMKNFLYNKTDQNIARNLMGRQTDFDELLSWRTETFPTFSYNVPEYRAYDCMIPGFVPSNNNRRSNALRLQDFRNTPDSKLKMSNITDYFICLSELMLDAHQNIIAESPSLRIFWKDSVAYNVALRGLHYFKIAYSLFSLLQDSEASTVTIDASLLGQDKLRELSIEYLAYGMEFISEAKQFMEIHINDTAMSEIVTSMSLLISDSVKLGGLVNVTRNLDLLVLQPSQALVDHCNANLNARCDDSEKSEFLRLGGEVAKLGVLALVLVPGLFFHLWTIYQRKVHADIGFDEKVSEFHKSYESVFAVVAKPFTESADLLLPLQTEFYSQITVVSGELIGLDKMMQMYLNALDGIVLINQITGLVDIQCKENSCYLFESSGASFAAAAGVPQRSYKHAAQACTFAVAVVDKVRQMRLVTGKEIKEMGIQIGVATGSAMVGLNCGTSLSPYTLYGTALTESVVMRKLSKPHKILVNESCFAEINDDINVSSNFTIESRCWAVFTEKRSYWLSGSLPIK